jgi:hypothetical protein
MYKEGGRYDSDYYGQEELQKEHYGEISKLLAGGGKGNPVSTSAVYKELLAQWARNGGPPTYYNLLKNHIAEEFIRTGSAENSHMLDLFLNDISKGIASIDPNWNGEVLEPISALLGSISKEAGLDEEAKKTIYNNVAAGILDMAGEVGIEKYPTEYWTRKGNEMARLAAGQVIDNLKYTNSGESTVSNLEGVGASGNLLKLYKDLEEHPEILYVQANGETRSIINRATLDKIQNQAVKDVASVLGQEESNLMPGWEPEGAYDIKPIPTVRVLHGDNQGLYKYQVNEEKNGLNLMKLNTETGKWGLYRKGTADQNIAEDKKTIALTEKQNEYRDFINTLIKRKDDTYFINQTSDARPPDTAFYIEGYDPRTLNRVNKIPDDILEIIKRESTSQVWENILRSWKDKGIRTKYHEGPGYSGWRGR